MFIFQYLQQLVEVSNEISRQWVLILKLAEILRNISMEKVFCFLVVSLADKVGKLRQDNLCSANFKIKAYNR